MQPALVGSKLSVSGMRATDARFLFAGALMLSVAMGIGRFAYTPLIPVMERDAGLTVASAGALAFWNLVGYLVGASIAMLPATHGHRLTIARASLLVVIVTTAAMALPSAFWLPLRFSTGVGSGLAMIFSSSIVLDYAARHRQPSWPPFFFSGVGIGIAFSGFAVPAFAAHGGSHAAWLGIAAAAALAFCGTTAWFRDEGPGVRLAAASSPDSGRSTFGWLLAVYAVEGFAYVIPATFLVAIVTSVPALAPYAAASWVLVGLTGLFSTFGWIGAGATWGKVRALTVALALQAAGMIATVVSHHPIAVIFAAMSLGGTFIAITLFATALGRDMFPHAASSAVSRLTTVYSIGQILGPPVATAVALHSGSYDVALLCAAGVAAVAALGTFAFVRGPALPLPAVAARAAS